jgi:hypothetical protein
VGLARLLKHSSCPPDAPGPSRTGGGPCQPTGGGPCGTAAAHTYLIVRRASGPKDTRAATFITSGFTQHPLMPRLVRAPASRLLESRRSVWA